MALIDGSGPGKGVTILLFLFNVESHERRTNANNQY